jgi:hypothetical protein
MKAEVVESYKFVGLRRSVPWLAWEASEHLHKALSVIPLFGAPSHLPLYHALKIFVGQFAAAISVSHFAIHAVIRVGSRL